MNSHPPIWSILVAGITDRPDPYVVRKLLHQIEPYGATIQFCYCQDNRILSVGEKRNLLLDMARGTYLSFVDDDDDVDEGYVGEIMPRLADAQPDVVVFRQVARLHTAGTLTSIHHCTYDLAHLDRDPRRMLEPRPAQHDVVGQPDIPEMDWSGPPAHTMVWSSELALGHDFPEIDFGEDAAWCDRVGGKADRSKQVVVDKVLYHYLFDSDKTATRG